MESPRLVVGKWVCILESTTLCVRSCSAPCGALRADHPGGRTVWKHPSAPGTCAVLLPSVCVSEVPGRQAGRLCCSFKEFIFMDLSGYCGNAVHNYTCKNKLLVSQPEDPWTLELSAPPGLHLLLCKMLKPGGEKLFQSGKHHEAALAGTAQLW